MKKKIIATKEAPTAIGPYNQGVEMGNMVFVSGQLPMDPKTGRLVEGGIKEHTVQVLKNIKAILAEAGLGIESIAKTTVLLSDLNNFDDMNEAYTTMFDGDFPARTTITAQTLPRESLVIIEAIAIK